MRYLTGDLPWDTGRHDKNLERAIRDGTIAPCRALELGCGTGTNALWLAAQGFDVTAVDISATALDDARKKAQQAEGEMHFMNVDIREQPLPGGPYDFAFDRGCFHSSRGEEERDLFVRRVHTSLSPGGQWLSLIGSTDAPPRDGAPPQLSAGQIAAHVETLFEIRSLCATHFDSDQPAPAAAWACLMRKR